MSSTHSDSGSNDAGSYAYTELEKGSQELNRLELQARIAAEIEKKTLCAHGLKANDRVLDVGCGPGLISSLIAQIVAPGEVLGMDLNPELLAQAEANRDKSGLNNLSFQEGNVYELSEFKNGFDFIYCRFVFQHLERKAEALNNLFQCLAPGGRLLIVDVDDGLVLLEPAHDTFTKIFEQQRLCQGKLGGDREIGRKLPTLFKKAGFHNIQPVVETLTSWQLGTRNFLDLTTGYKILQLQNSESDTGVSKQQYESMLSDCDQGEYFGAVGLFAVSGAKPQKTA